MNTNYIFEYCSNPDDEIPMMDINQSIGYDPITGKGIDGTKFVKEITMLDSMGKKSIDIYINSQGGSVTEGYSIFTSIYRCKTPTNGYVGGAAASTAGWILQACTNRYMFSFSNYMVHNPAYKGAENTGQIDPFLELIKYGLMDMLKTKKLSDIALNKMMNAETYMGPKEALMYGFIDEILDINEEVGAENTEYIMNNISSEMVNIVEKYALLENQIKDNIKNKKNKTMDSKISQLKKMLNLSDSVSEAEIVNAAKAEYPWMFKFADQIFNEPTSPSVKNEEMKLKMENENDSMDDCYNDDDESVIDSADGIKANPNIDNKMKKEIANLKKQIAELKNIKASEMVNSAAKDGRISDAEVPHYVKLANLDYNTTELVLNSIKVSKKAESLTNAIDKEKSEVQKAEILEAQKEEVKAEIENAVTESGSWDNVDYNSLFGKKFDTLK